MSMNIQKGTPLGQNENHPPIYEPFKATKLWNDAVRAFYNGVPMSKHWRGLRQYDNCFTAMEAIEWLHNHLKLNPNFGPSVTKEQTIKLLRKFLKSGLIVEARGNKVYPDDFRENRELFKFGNRSPLRSLRTPRRPALASLSSNVTKEQSSCSESNNIGSSPILCNKSLTKTKQTPEDIKRCRKENFKNATKDENFLLYSDFPSPEETDKVWKEIFLQKLEEISENLMVSGNGTKPLVDLSFVDASFIRRNMRISNYKLTLQLEELKSKSLSNDFPDWILSAMKCLVSWPNSSESICNIPNYPGVEIDIFRIVRDYFINLIIPLIPYELYDSLVRLYIGSEFYDIINRMPSDSPIVNADSNFWPGDRDSLSTSSSDSVEDLLLNMSINGNQQTSTPCLNDCYNLPEIDSCSKLKSLKVCSEFKTPHAGINFLNLAPPQSLKLNKLQEYTDFKESYLYPAFHIEDSTQVKTSGGTVSLNRKTLKSLKNRGKSNVKVNSSPCEISFDNFSTPPMVFDKLLKAEELDNFLLPPNSCFETAFTSDSPKTRIIPQKSVDTIHFRNNIRPMSIAVSSFVNETKSCNALNKLKEDYVNSTSYQNKINNLFLSQYNLNSSMRNKSQSEGNLLSYFTNSLNDISGVPLSPPEHFKDGDHYGKRKKSAQDIPKNSFTSRLRDSLKRKRSRDLTKKVNGKIAKPEYKTLNSSHFISTDTLVSPSESEASYSSNASKLRTNSGGYQNPSMALISNQDESSEIQSFVSLSLSDSVSAVTDFSHSKEVLNLVNQSSSSSQFRISRPPSHSLSINSDLSKNSDSILYQNEGTTGFSSQMQSGYSSASLRKNCCNRSKSATPTGCLSHSMTSSFGNTFYHSALSGLNQNELSRTSKMGIYVSENNKNISNIVETATPPPILPRRVPFINKYFNDSNVIADDLGLLHDYQNLNCDKKALSTSANELSDNWTDRTPFGRAPPYVHGGVWKHYYSSPSLLTKMGKGICIEALQLVLLLLEPQRKRALYLLLRMMNKVSSNDKLQLDKEVTNRALMVKTFARSVLLSEKEVDYDEVLVIRILTFMMDNHESIFSPPQHLAVLVHRNIIAYKSLKHANTKVPSTNEIRHKTFCQRVSPQTFEKQKLTGSQKFLFELLDQIMDNPKLCDKEKKKKIKEFKMHYPEIYNCRFPPGKENQFIEPKKRLRGFKKFVSIKNLARTKSFRI